MSNENQVGGLRFTETYDSLSAETILLAIMLKIIEDLGTRHCAGGGMSAGRRSSDMMLPPYNLDKSR